MRHAAFFGFVTLLLFIGAGPASAQDATPPATPHDVEGKEQCTMCHASGMDGIPQNPASHEGRGNDTCQMCHAADSPMMSAAPAPIPHDTEGKEQCQMCHSGAMDGIPATPDSHEGWSSDNCTMCHKPES